MSELEGGGEVSESAEVSEAPAEETGGEASEETQEAAVDEANETGGFDDSETAETSDVGLDEEESEEDPDGEGEESEADETGFEDEAGLEDGEDFAEESAEQDDESVADEDGIGFDDGEEQPEEDSAEESEDAGETDTAEDENGVEDSGDASEEIPENEASEEPEEDSAEEEIYEDDLDDDLEEDPGEEEDYSDAELEENAEEASEKEEPDEDAEVEPDGETQPEESEEDSAEDEDEEPETSEETPEEGAETSEEELDKEEQPEEPDGETQPEEPDEESEETPEEDAEASEEELSEDMEEDSLEEEYDDISEEDPGEEEDYSDEAVDEGAAGAEESVEEAESLEDIEDSEAAEGEESAEDTESTKDAESPEDAEEAESLKEDDDSESTEEEESTEEPESVEEEAQEEPDGEESPESEEDNTESAKNPEEEPEEEPAENSDEESEQETAESPEEKPEQEPSEESEEEESAEEEETSVPEDMDRKAGIGEETRQSLESFEQNNWDNLSRAEKEKAVEDLRDNIAEDLQLENKPDVAYYNNPDPGDYGGYAASNNTIYINRFNMGDAGETADTIAHESRHCWQHERAEHPETEQDYQFKENFDNYVKPEENFERYLDQPVERDARDYAEQVEGQIGTGDGPREMPSEPEEAVTDDSRTEEETRAPPEAEESKTVTELPSDFESKQDVRGERTSECYRKYGEIVKDVYENSGGSIIRKSNGDTYKELTQDEKTQLADKGKELIQSIPKEERGDFRVPDVNKIKGVREDGRIEENWKDGTDGAVPGTRHMETPAKGDVIDRVGASNGYYFAAMKEDGTPLSLEERAIGDYVPEKDITKNESYHSYEIKQDFTKENFEQALKDRYGVTDDMPFERTPPEYQSLKNDLDQYYEDCADDTSESNGHEGEKYADTAETADGVKTSKIDSMFTSEDGGGKQYITPFDAQTLMDLGMIEERGD